LQGFVESPLLNAEVIALTRSLAVCANIGDRTVTKGKTALNFFPVKTNIINFEASISVPTYRFHHSGKVLLAQTLANGVFKDL
jgi:hypothetical protein